jgi:hypothetical protein
MENKYENKFVIAYIHGKKGNFWIPSENEIKNIPFNLNYVYYYNEEDSNPEWKLLTYDIFKEIVLVVFERTFTYSLFLSNIQKLKSFSFKFDMN